MGSFYKKIFFEKITRRLPYLFIFYCVSVMAQGEANIWYFGGNAGLNFNNNPPTPLLDLPNGDMFSSEGCSTISDSDGNLLFYTNGEKVWNRIFQIMSNGDNLAGHNSSSQSSAIIPYPGTYNFVKKRFDRYFLVTLDDYSVDAPVAADKGVRFSEIDMNLDNGLGAVTVNKNSHLFGTTTTEKVCVVPHSNGCDYWVICKVVDSNDFYTYRVSSSGFNTVPVISTTSLFVDARPGQMKVSPNHKLLSFTVPTSSIYYGFYVFNFDNNTGLITDKFTDRTSGENQYGTEFSPDSKVLYKCSGRRIYQYDVTTNSNSDFIASKTTIMSSTNGLLSMQLAPDSKIYIARPILNSPNGRIGVINNPNLLGLNCDYVAEQQYIGGGISLAGLPNQLNYLVPHNSIVIENELCNGLQLSLENNNNINSYNWQLAYANNPLVIIGTSTDSNPTLQFPIPNEDYVITCSIISDCYSNTYKLLFTPNDLNYSTPIFNFSTLTYCQNQVPDTLPLTSVDGIAGTWQPSSVNTTNIGITTYTFTPNQGQCANPITINVEINSEISINFPDVSICEGQSIAFPSTNNVSGVWVPAIVSNTNSNTYTFIPDEGCFNSAQWTVVVNQNNNISFEDTAVCYGGIITFPNTNGIIGTWSPTSVSNTQSGIYTFTPNNSCSPPATWQVLVVESFSNLTISTYNTTIIANVDNVNSLLLYQLNNGNFQDSNTFENVNPGCHTVNVTDIYGCTNLSSSVFVFDYPKFFSPNNDGYNDFWNVFLENSDTTLSIFDRYGKLLKQIRQDEVGWDGTYNGYKLPSTDYWFVLDYDECGIKRTFKSHFTLIR